MKFIIFFAICLSFWTNASTAEEWEGKKILVDQRDKVISACEKGISSRGFPYAKVQKYCECFIDYVTEIANKYNKEQIKGMAAKKGKDFIEKEASQKCIHFLK